jgi:urease accessory protein
VLQALDWLPRTEGSVRLGLARRGERTRVICLEQAGAARLKFPRLGRAEPCEAVLINTAGGLTGGDTFQIAASLEAGANATLTTAAAEKIYRARTGTVSVSVDLALAGNAKLAWLPQPTILFDRAALERTTKVELAADASFLALEISIFGRAAMGESLRQGSVYDAWRVHRAGVLVFADALRLEGPIAELIARPALMGGAGAIGLLIYVAPAAQERIETARAILHNAGGVAGVSAFNGMLVARAAAADGRTLQAHLAPLIEALHGRPLPRIWTC